MRVVAYNIRHGRGIDHRVSTRRVAELLAALEPDVVGLNEVRLIPGLSDQPRLLAEWLGMTALFQHNHGYALAGGGNLILVRGEAALRADILLPGGLERRGCLLADANVGGRRFVFATTHLSLGRTARQRQLAFVAGVLPRDTPLVLGGDFNCGLREATPLREALLFPDDEPPTFPAHRPRRPLDHIGWRGWRLTALHTVPSPASDHLPLVADLEPV